MKHIKLHEKLDILDILGGDRILNPKTAKFTQSAQDKDYDSLNLVLVLVLRETGLVFETSLEEGIELAT